MLSSNHNKYIFLFLFLCLVVTALYAEDISFKNFSNRIVLKQSDNNRSLYTLPAKNIQLHISDRLILKTANSMTKNSLASTYSFISDVTELYIMDNSTYYTATIKKIISINDAMQELQKNKSIYLVQPDILQLKQEHDFQTLQKNRTDHIKLLNIDNLWRSTKGKRIKIAIIDDGFDLSHEDLKEVKVAFEYDVETQSLDASAKHEIDRHGTMVAGVIFAQHNGMGIDGVAPDAQLIAIRHTNTWTSKTILSFYLSRLAGADIINCSWSSQLLLEPISDIIADFAENGRSGKGTAVIFAAGNRGEKLLAYSSETTLDNVITVGSINRHGKRMKFSNYGKEGMFYTYGEKILTTTLHNRYGYFSGTSASAPIVSGLIALLLSENPELSLDEIKTALKKILDG